MERKKNNFLEKLRQKSDIEKRVIAFNSALLITLIIFAVWTISTFSQFDGEISDDVNYGIGNIKEQTATPISALKDSFKNLIDTGSELYELE